MGQSSYPGVLDSDIELPRVDDNITEIGAEAINSIRDAIFSIEQAIGLSPGGNKSDFVTRVNQALDEDGRIKTTALSDRGLVVLPISNSQIGSNAAILESKLDLNFSTSALNGKIVSNTSDIDAVRDAFNAFASQTINHFGGTGNRHDGYQIDLTSSIRSSLTVEKALNVLNNDFTDHEGSASSAHAASSITTSDEFINFSATNVQSALSSIDNLSATLTQTHQDKMHSNGTALNKRGEQSSRGNLADTVMAVTIFETEVLKATNILQVMRPNVARITSKNADLGFLGVGSQQTLRVQAGGVGRGVIDINLAAIIPTDDMDVVVSEINTKCQLSSVHYPVSAYNVGGKLVIAHTMPGQEFTIQILDTVQFSAATALGFGDVAGSTITWSGTSHSAYVGGKLISDFKSLVKKNHVHGSAPLSTIALGIGDLSLKGLTVGNEGRVLCNITNHSTTPTDNGTHYILSFPTSETFILSSDITLGSFDIEIAADSVNFDNSASGELFDIFVVDDQDGYGLVTKSNRVSYGPISGVNISSVSKDFPTTGMDWEVVDSNSIVLHDALNTGVSVDIPTGFLGQLKVLAPDNVNSMLVEVTGVPSSARRSMSVSAFQETDDKLYVGSVSYSGNLGLAVLAHPTDHRQMGAVVTNKSYDKLDQVDLEDTTKELRNNGIIRGLDVISIGATSLEIRGGRALVDGRIIDVETQTIEIRDVSASTKLLLLNVSGSFIVKDEFDPGYSFSSLTAGDAYGDTLGFAIIGEFTTNGTSIDGYFSDRRLMVSKLDKRLLNTKNDLERQITEIRSTVAGSSWGFTVIEANGGDGYVAGIEVGSNNGFSYIPFAGENEISARGFAGGNALITTRRFEFSDLDTMTTSVFRAVGLTHINVFIEAIYTGIEAGIDGPFGVSGEVFVEVGVGIERGLSALTTGEAYARVKTINTGVLPVKSQTERYVASIPVSQLSLPENVMFDLVPRIKIINSNFVDGGTSADHEPTIRFDSIRVVTSSYSIAGHINNEDGTSTSIAATVGDIL